MLPTLLNNKFPILKLLVISLLIYTIPQNKLLAQSFSQSEFFPGDRTSNLVGAEKPYTLGGGDRLAIDFFNIQEYSKEYQVSVDGTINLPLIGRVVVKGLTVSETSQRLTQIYTERRLLTAPLINVNLVGIRPIGVSVVGEIKNPGSYTIEFKQGIGGGAQFPRLTDALKLANGVTASADIRGIRIVRMQGNGQEVSRTVNLWDFLQSGDRYQDITLRDGDRVVIPSVERVNVREVRIRANADFSANLNIPITITMVGEVNRPGPYTLSGNDTTANALTDQLSVQANTVLSEENKLAGLPTVSRAIKTSGGLTAKADVRNIQVVRSLPSGQQQVTTINLWKLLETGDVEQDLLLQEGDAIVIPTAQNIDISEARQIAVASFSPNSIRVNIAGEVKNPGIKDLPPNVSLQQAILTAGGFVDRRAQSANAELIRLNPNGTVERKRITVNFAQGLDNENNPPLLNNDMIFVERSSLAVASDSIFSFLDPFNQVLGFMNLVKSTFEFNFDDGNNNNNNTTLILP